MRLATKIAYNTIVQIIGKVIATVFGLAAIAIMTRHLGQTGFGQYTTIMTFLSFFGVIADLGLTLVTVQMISDEQADHNKILSNLFSLRLASATIFLGLAPLIIFFFPYDPLIKLGVAITTLSFFFTALNQILVGLFQKHLKMIIVSLAEIIGRLVLLAGIILAIKLGYGLIGIMIATVISSAIGFAIHYCSSGRYATIKLRFDPAVWFIIVKKSWPLALTIIFNLIYLRADTLLLSLLKSQTEVGLYGAAYKVVDVLTTLPFMFAGIILPIATASWINQETERFKNIMQKSFDVLVIMAIPMLIGAQLTARPVMTLIAGSEFALAGAVLKILILATAIIFLGCLFAHAIIALDQQKKMIGAYIFTALTALAGYLIFIPKYSYFGAAWVTVYSESVIALASFYLVIKYSGFKPKLPVLFKSLAASLIMVLAIWLTLNKINLILVLSLAVVIYLLALYYFKGITRQDILDLLNK